MQFNSTHEAEMSLLGALLLSPHAIATTDISIDDLELSESRVVFKALLNQKEKSDFVTILSEIGEEYKKFLMQCLDILPHASGLQKYIDIVKEESARRKIYNKSMDLLNGLIERADLPDIQKQLSDMSKECELINTKSNEVAFKDSLLKFFKAKSKPREYIKSGFSKLDSRTFIDKSDYAIIAGRPSAGKTAFALNLCKKLAKKYNVGFYSLETQSDKITDRLFTSIAGLDFSKVKGHLLDESDWERAAEASIEASKLNFTIINAAGKSVSWIQSNAIKNKFDIIFVDYIGLIKSDEKSRYEKVTSISIDLHIMAQTTGITIFALSQLKRNDNKKPTLEDLRESGQLEQDADLVILLHNDKERREYFAIVAKNKEGETGEIAFNFDGARQTFTEIEVRR